MGMVTRGHELGATLAASPRPAPPRQVAPSRLRVLAADWPASCQPRATPRHPSRRRLASADEDPPPVLKPLDPPGRFRNHTPPTVPLSFFSFSAFSLPLFLSSFSFDAALPHAGAAFDSSGLPLHRGVDGRWAKTSPQRKDGLALRAFRALRPAAVGVGAGDARARSPGLPCGPAGLGAPGRTYSCHRSTPPAALACLLSLSLSGLFCF
ncbi:hypothetical protein CDD83_2332 [Cordyceps sp. RAO-2017]|nr:hypothetical protein CDD83_2332 [Cordyceps sp. RAO-2017]